MNQSLPHPPFPFDELQSNITYGEVQSMTFESLSEWIDLLRSELKQKWDEGIPPYQGVSVEVIKDKFKKLKDFKSSPKSSSFCLIDSNVSG